MTKRQENKFIYNQKKETMTFGSVKFPIKQKQASLILQMQRDAETVYRANQILEADSTTNYRYSQITLWQILNAVSARKI